MNYLKKFRPTKGLLIIMAALFIQSCQKEETLTITEEDIADVVTASLESETGGLAYEFSMKTAYIFEDSDELSCANTVTMSKTFVKSSGVRTGQFIYNWEVLKNCSEAVASISWTGNYNGTFETPRLSGTTSGSRNWTISGIETSNNILSLNGTFIRNGSHTSKVRQRRSFVTEISFEFGDIAVNKATKEIQSGVGALQVSINASDGASRKVTGTIAFNGNGSATLLINGKTYIITI
ncbi:hypothetical protein [Aquiflexum sp.]|uniref:hypothetical protein n=1 Tax=Aquiflexum sp. TaxID=1872584 RepID=UPI0035945387